MEYCCILFQSRSGSACIQWVFPPGSIHVLDHDPGPDHRVHWQPDCGSGCPESQHALRHPTGAGQRQLPYTARHQRHRQGDALHG